MSETGPSADGVRPPKRPCEHPHHGNADHPHTDPGDGRTECQRCGKWVWLVTHSCKGVPVTEAAMARQEVWLEQGTNPYERGGV